MEKGTGRTALHFAALDSNLDATMALVEAGCNKEARDADGLTPLHLACRVAFRSDPAVALFLIRLGASALAADSQGEPGNDGRSDRRTQGYCETEKYLGHGYAGENCWD